MSVDSLKAQRRQKKESRKTYKNRRNGVRDIANKINNLSYDTEDVCTQVNQCASYFRSGLKGEGIGNISTLDDDILATKEADPWDDSSLSSSKSNLESEKTRCQNRMDTLDYEINQLGDQIIAEGGFLFPWE